MNPLESSVDPTARIPLHVQIAGMLRDQIHGHTLAPGEPLPSEAELQEQFSVSRSVARQAMTTLVNEGLVVRGRGRGSVVAPERQHHRLVHRAAGLSTQISATGVTIRTRVLSLTREIKPALAADFPGEYAYRLERLRFIDGNAAAYIRTWLPEEFGRQLTEPELEDASLHEILATRFGAGIAGGARQVRAVAADEDLARLLTVRSGAPLLLLEGRTTDSKGALVEVFATWHRGDLITFDIEVNESSANPTSLPAPVASPIGGTAPVDLGRAEELARELSQELDRLRATL